MASTPPLSPTPRRWSPSNKPSPLVETLTALADNHNRSLLSPTSRSAPPEITTTSPSPQRPTDPDAITPQYTGGTSATLNQRYDDLFARLDELGGSLYAASPTPSTGSALQLAPSPPPPSPPPSDHQQHPSSPSLPFSPSRTPKIPSPSRTPVPQTSSSQWMPSQQGLHGLGISIRVGPRTPDILDTLTEHTEPTSSDSGRSGASGSASRPTPKVGRSSERVTLLSSPSSPVKPAGAKGVKNLRSFFEEKTADPQPPHSASFGRASPDKRPGLPTPSASSSPVKQVPMVPTPVQSPPVPPLPTRLSPAASPDVKPLEAEPPKGDSLPSPAWRRSPVPPANPPQSSSGLGAQSSSFRNIIASWSARTATETAADAPGSGGLKRDRVTNFSLRRRRRHDSGSSLAEVTSGNDRSSSKSPSPTSTDRLSPSDVPREASPAQSVRANSSPKIVTGQVSCQTLNLG